MICRHAVLRGCSSLSIAKRMSSSANQGTGSPFNPKPNFNFELKRNELVHVLRLLGIHDERVINAMKFVPRHEFVLPDEQRQEIAYENHPLPIGKNQTISQPWMVAEMCQLAKIKETDKILEIGSGCGYNAAVMAQLGDKVYSTEIIPDLHDMSKSNIEKLGYKNIVLYQSDGSMGLPEYAPYDVIMVTASPTNIPNALKEQLAVGGRMIIPVHSPERGYDLLYRVVKDSNEECSVEHVGDVRFVPLTGIEGRV